MVKSPLGHILYNYSEAWFLWAPIEESSTLYFNGSKKLTLIGQEAFDIQCLGQAQMHSFSGSQ